MIKPTTLLLIQIVPQGTIIEPLMFLKLPYFPLLIVSRDQLVTFAHVLHIFDDSLLSPVILMTFEKSVFSSS